MLLEDGRDIKILKMLTRIAARKNLFSSPDFNSFLIASLFIAVKAGESDSDRAFWFGRRVKMAIKTLSRACKIQLEFLEGAKSRLKLQSDRGTWRTAENFAQDKVLPARPFDSRLHFHLYYAESNKTEIRLIAPMSWKKFTADHEQILSRDFFRLCRKRRKKTLN